MVCSARSTARIRGCTANLPNIRLTASAPIVSKRGCPSLYPRDNHRHTHARTVVTLACTAHGQLLVPRRRYVTRIQSAGAARVAREVKSAQKWEEGRDGLLSASHGEKGARRKGRLAHNTNGQSGWPSKVYSETVRVHVTRIVYLQRVARSTFFSARLPCLCSRFAAAAAFSGEATQT